MPKLVFQCGTIECDNSMDATGLNKIRLEALRRWPKTCEKCKRMSVWQPQMSLLDEPENNINGGNKNVKRSDPGGN